ncbi:MAG: hypothetical protein RPS47_18095 [Colwellia sp.]|jgi:hypothetical protein
MRYLLIILTIITYCTSADSLVVGKTYEISEPNPYNEISDRSKKIDWKKITKKAIQRKTYIEKMRFPALPKTLKNKIRLITPMASAPADINDQYGKTLYKKGYKFNPLEYRKLSGRIIIVDEEDIFNIELLPNDTVIINRGDIYNVSKEIKKPTFILDKFTASTLSLRSSPTIISQVGSQLEYKEIFVEAVK